MRPCRLFLAGVLGHEGEGPPRRVRVRDNKRGAAAWEHAKESGESDLASLGTRLLAHAVADRTALQSYLPAVEKWLNFVEERRLPCTSWSERDQALLGYLAFLCYIDDAGPAEGSSLMNGLGVLYPGQPLPLAWQGLKAWQRGFVEHFGVALPLETLAVMEDDLCRHKDPLAQCAGDMIPIAADGYLRRQDLLGLRVEDCVFYKDEGVLKLGVSGRGESTKTGRNQTVRLDHPHSIEVLRRRCAGRPARAKVFEISPEAYNKWWRWAAAQAGADAPPHSARHTGASVDLARGYRSLDQVKRRGRWSAEKSVERYAKTGAWLAAEAAQPSAVRERGAALLQQRLPRPVHPRE